MSYGVKVFNPQSVSILDGQSRTGILVKSSPLPYRIGFFDDSNYPVPVAGCTPSTHFAITVNGSWLPIVQNGQVSYIDTNKAQMYSLDDFYDTLLVYRYQ